MRVSGLCSLQKGGRDEFQTFLEEDLKRLYTNEGMWVEVVLLSSDFRDLCFIKNTTLTNELTLLRLNITGQLPGKDPRRSV